MRSIVSIAAITALTTAALSAPAAAQRPEPAPTGAQRVAAQRAAAQGGKVNKPLAGAAAIKSGAYTLSLTPAVIDGHTAGKNVHASISDVDLTSNGNVIDMKDATGATLHGSLNGRAFKVAGQSGDGTLTLSGMGFSNSVTGSFALTMNGRHKATGNFALSAKPVEASGTKNLRNFDDTQKKASSSCNWWCTFKSWVSL
ncbi:MAG TPA: hypothetical protein VN650_10010 [Gemmatimonadaceae bacterium]|nr:hypothetical protein [Gemmatimonadaceae bacterium]